MDLGKTLTSIFFLLIMLAACCNAGHKVKKVVIHVPYHVKKIHHTHTVYKVIKEPKKKGHGGHGHGGHHHSWH